MSPHSTVLFLLALIASAAADTFVWMHSSNWNDPSNWKQGRLPCSAETVKLTRPTATAGIPQRQKFEVRVDVDVTLKRLVLPKGSGMKLNKGVRLTFSRKTTCTAAGLTSVSDTSVNEFIGVQPHPWNCANNWERQSDKMRATRVPCQSDTVQFPAGKSYSWIKLDTDIKVAALEWQGKPVQSLSQIPNADSYFVETTPLADLTVNTACSTSPSACPCLLNDCSFYPTSPPPPTTKAATTAEATTKAATTAEATTKAATTVKATTNAGTTSVKSIAKTSTSGMKPTRTQSTTGTPCDPLAIGCNPVVICNQGDRNCNTPPPPTCEPHDTVCINRQQQRDSTSGSNSEAIWPIIVGVLIGVVALLVIVVLGMVLLRRRTVFDYQKEDHGSPNAVYSSTEGGPTVQLSFENPMYTEDKQTVDNVIYQKRVDGDTGKECEVFGGTYDNFDEDGLPI